MPILKPIAFLGYSLSGLKSQKTSMCRLEYFFDQKRLFLADLKPKVGHDKDISGDQVLLEWTLNQSDVQSLTFDTPLTLPPCFDCNCSRVLGNLSLCQKPDVIWMNQHFEKMRVQFKSKEALPPIAYLQRPIDVYFKHFDEKFFDIDLPLGSNMAPLLARTRFVLRQLSDKNYPTHEINKKIVSYRLGKKWGLPESITRYLHSSANGETARAQFLKALIDKGQLFIYKQDLKILAQDFHAFNSVLSAYMGFLKFTGQVEELKENAHAYPESSDWSLIPKINI